MKVRWLLATSLITVLILQMPVSSSSTWDLSIMRITLFPPNAEVQQGQPLLITIYVENNELAQFSGAISVSLYVDGFLKSRENWWVGNLSVGSVPIPSGGYRTIVTSLETSTLTVGIHELTVEISPKDYIDPRPDDNRYSLNFVVIPLVNPFIEAEGEMLQGKEHKVFVHVPNPKSEPMERLEVRLFANGSEIGSKEISVPPNSIIAAQFYYKPAHSGNLIMEALLVRDGQPIGRASMSVSVKPSCDLTLASAYLDERIFAGEPISGKIIVQNRGPSGTRGNISLAVDGEVLESRQLDFIDPGEGTEIEFSLNPSHIELGSHNLNIAATPLDAADLNSADNELSISFTIMPVPVSISLKPSEGGIDVNLTNLAGVMAYLRLSLVSNGSEVRRINVTLEAHESRLIPIRGLDPGNYTLLAYNRGTIVASTEFEIKGGFALEGASPLWLIAIIPLAGAVIYLALMRRRKKWPS